MGKCRYNIYFCFDKHKVKQRLNIGPSPAREKWFGYVFARSEGMRGVSTRARNPIVLMEWMAGGGGRGEGKGGVSGNLSQKGLYLRFNCIFYSFFRIKYQFKFFVRITKEIQIAGPSCSKHR